MTAADYSVALCNLRNAEEVLCDHAREHGIDCRCRQCTAYAHVLAAKQMLIDDCAVTFLTRQGGEP